MAPMSAINKPNPYVITDLKNSKSGGDNAEAGGMPEVKYSYPKSKIFVGGLDFKLTVDELKDHFTQYGEVADGIILKDIFTG